MDNPQPPEPIAIIGLSGKFAGDAIDSDGLWKMIAEGRDAWSQIPTSRFNSEGSYHPDHERSGTMHVRAAYFLKQDVGEFDAAFFNLSAETAASMDPQFRLQLESVYEALENAGQPLKEVAGSNTSVYMGTFNHDYREGMIRDEDDLPRFMITGTGAAMASNRVSHFFDLRGASMTLDTGCSTSLVALHQAVQDLRSGGSDMAVVGSSNLMLNPDMFKALGSIGVLSPDGKSFSFDSRSNGYGRGEGVATVIVKRWKDAVAAGDPIRAIIRETCVNQDGKTETITTPSLDAQQELIRKCYSNALLDPLETHYFEAHGTGTPTGDPIELQAIAAVFKAKRERKEPLMIGSIKANIGHTEPVSGLASLIKVVLALEHGAIPPSINFQKPNAKLDLASWNIKVPQQLEPWPTNTDGVRRASINNFGYGGTNAHIIVEMGAQWLIASDAPATNGIAHIDNSLNGVGPGPEHNAKPGCDASTSGPPRKKTKVLVLSARDERGCQEMVSNLREYLQQQRHHQHPDRLLQSIIYTLGQRRTTLLWVAAHPITYTHGIDKVIEALDSTHFKPKRVKDSPRIGMVFTGQGAQWYAMGRELIIAYPVFKASLEEGDVYLKELSAEWSLIEELMRDSDTTRVYETAVSIPICTALQISLLRLLSSWGIKPAAVTSHSSGEIAAAYAAGVIDYRSAISIAHHRSVLSADSTLRGSIKGGMVAVGTGLEDAEVYLQQLTGDGKACVACINSHKSVTIAGDLSAVTQVEHMAKSNGVLASRLNVDIGYHSHQMLPIADQYRESLSVINHGETLCDFDSIIYSSPVTGGLMTDAEEVANRHHWVSSLVQPVKFLDAFTDMVLGRFDPSGSSVDVVVEVGPHTALRGPIRQILELPEFTGLQLPYYGCLSRNSDARDTMQRLAASLMAEGWVPRLDPLNFPYGRDVDIKVLGDLPSYPWNHQVRHWVEPRFNKSLRERDQQPHSLIGSLVLGTELTCPSWRHILRLSESPWLRDHVVQSNVLYPGAGFVCLALAAAAQMVSFEAIKPTDSSQRLSGYRLRDIEILRALLIQDNDAVEVQTRLRPADSKEIGLKGWFHFEILSVTGDNRWALHANGSIKVDYASGSTPEWTRLDGLTPTISASARRIAPDDLFDSFRSVGIEHGPVFQNLETIAQSRTETQSKTTLVIADIPETISNNILRNGMMHPTTLDSIVQAAYTALPKAGYFLESPRVPRRIGSLWISSSISHNAGHKFDAFSRVNDADSQSFEADIRLFDANQDSAGTRASVLEIEGLFFQSLGQGISSGKDKAWKRDVCNKLEWGTDLALASPESLDKMKRQLEYSDPPERLSTELRPICLYFIRQALERLEPLEISSHGGHFAKYYKWMQDQVELAPEATSNAGDSVPPWQTAQEVDRHMGSATANSVVGDMVCRLGPHLTDMLRGEKSPLELMAQDGLLSRYYSEAPNLKRCFTQLSQLLNKVIHKNPRARILEIGAGTGSVTRHALEVLGTSASGGPLASLYHYTDVSLGFFEAAQGEFSAWSDILAFDKLDIEQDAAAQGFALGSYDVVIACQVLHATKSISRTMDNVRSLMKPEGSLLLIETTQDQIDIQFVFGLLPGWWLSEEPNRKTSPSLDIASWDSVLKGAGFTGTDIAVNDSEDASTYAFTTILSRVQQIEASPRLRPEDVVVITCPSATPPSAWITSMAQSLGGTDDDSLAVYSLYRPTTTEATYRGKICVFLGEQNESLLFDINSTALESLKLVVSNCAGLLWVTVGGAVNCENPCSALATGFARSLRNEYVGRRILTLDLDPATPLWTPTSCRVISQVLQHAFQDTDDYDAHAADFEYAERDGAILIPRYFKDMTRNELVSPNVRIQSQDSQEMTAEETFHQDRPLSLDVGIRGLLDTMTFDDNNQALSSTSELPQELLEIEVHAYGLNFRDVMVAMGQLEDKIMGIECAGVIRRVGSRAALHGHAIGDRVFALLRGPFASRVYTEHWNAVPMPERLTFEEAASMPMVFTTAYVALVEVAHLQRGQCVLIHAAAGGVGQAAIQLAQHLGVDIYATVGSAKKRHLIRDKYGIPDHHIFNSRDASFASCVLDMTGGRGVDMVLNSLGGQLLQESFSLVARFGHFVEIGKRDFEQNSYLEMRPFTRQMSFSSIDILQMTAGRGTDVRRVLTEIARLIDRKAIFPVHPLTSYPISNITKAFRLMQTGAHMGKIVVSTGTQEMVPVRHHQKAVKLSADASYLLVGGLGGIGRCLACWLVSIGAKTIILLSRSAGTTDNDGLFIRDLTEMGCKIECISCDISKDHDLERALRLCTVNGLPPIRGVIQAAMVLKDSVLEQMTIENFKAAVVPKVNGSWNLHTRFQDVDFFIMLSSINGIVGYASQSNYSAGGSYQDALARWRVSHGLPAVSLDLCAVKTVGYVAETAGVAARMQRAGHMLLREDQLLGLMESAILSPFDPQIVIGLNTGPGSHWNRDGESQLGRDARFTALHYRQSQQRQSKNGGSTSGNSLASSLAEASSRTHAETIIFNAIAQKLAAIFFIPVDEIKPSEHPSKYGIDSLVAVELRNMISLQAAADISIFGILQSQSLGTLANEIVTRSSHTQVS